MLNQKNIGLGIFFVVLLLHLNIAWSEPDMQGSKDHPKIPRVAGTRIVGFVESSYDEGVFMTGTSRKKLLLEKIEGKRTRIMYAGPKDLSPFGVLRNYQKAFDNLGEVEEIYTCRSNKCFNNIGGIFIWRKSNRIPTSVGSDAQYFYSNTSYYRDQIYWYGKVTTPESRYHVSVYSTVITDRSHSVVKEFRNHPTIHLEVVEIADFEPTFEVVTAEDMATKISQKGHIALYGIYFALDSDVLKPKSADTLAEIAKALNTESGLSLYVVGHTDNKGSLDYNESLSKRRARSVVDELVARYGISPRRLTALGAGLMAPVASNKTADGQALNRRVELVER